jgi:hypothetical protein
MGLAEKQRPIRSQEAQPLQELIIRFKIVRIFNSSILIFSDAQADR